MEKMKTVLYSEDHEGVRRASLRLMKTRGYEPVLCEDGQKAFEAYLEEKKQGRQFNLIVTDWEMPVLDGIGLVKKLREDGYNGPIAMKTGRAPEDRKELEKFAEAQGVLGVFRDIGEALDNYEAKG